MAFLSAILFLIESFILLVLWWRASLFLKKNPNIVGDYIEKMALLSGIGMGVYSFMSFFFPGDSFLLGLFNIFGETFYLIVFVYGFSLFIYLISSVPQRKILTFGFLMVVFATISHFIFFPYPSIDKNGILHYNAPIVPGLTYSIFSLAGLLPLAIAFLHKGIKKPALRVRSFLFATAFLLIIFAGILLSIFTKTSIYISAFSLQTFGFILLLITAILRPKKENF